MNMEQQEFESFIRRVRPRLVAEAIQIVGATADAEDVVQDAALKLWSMRPHLGDYSSPDGLAVVIVRRLSLNRARSWSRSALPEQPTEWTPESAMISTEESARLEQTLRMLPDMQQAVLRMKHIDGLEVSEIARITGCSAEAVRQNLSRARRRILKMFRI